MPASWPSALNGLPRAGAALVADREMQQRAESKFVVSESTAMALVLALRDHVAVLPAGDALVARYRSLYFDTDDLSFFHAHRCGRRVRHKVRIRHYSDRALSVLEVKSRRGDHYTVKSRRSRVYGSNGLDSEDLAFVGGLCGPTGALRPQAWVTYRRVTLLGLTSPERVTLDMQLDMWRAHGHVRLRRAVVIEVKQPRLDLRSVAMHGLRAAGCRAGWMSKYCTAIALTSPDVPANRFLARIRHFETADTWS